MSWISKTRTFLREVKSEMEKVAFPSRDEVVGTTIVVIIASVIFATFLWLADALILQVYQGINRVFGA